MGEVWNWSTLATWPTPVEIQKYQTHETTINKLKKCEYFKKILPGAFISLDVL